MLFYWKKRFNIMLSANKKEFFTSFNAFIALAGIVVLSILAHALFFMQDMRPLLDHDSYYLVSSDFKFFVFLYDTISSLLNHYFPLLSYDGFFLYKMLNLVYLLPLIIFTYLTASSLYDRGVGLLAAFLMVSFPAVLNAFHKSEVNFMMIACYSMCIFFYTKSNFFKNIYFSLFCLLSFVFMSFHHYSFLLYLNVLIPVIVLINIYRMKTLGEFKVKSVVFSIAFVFLLEISFLFVLVGSYSSFLICFLTIFVFFILYKFLYVKYRAEKIFWLAVIIFLIIELFLVHFLFMDLRNAVELLITRLAGTPVREKANYSSLIHFLLLYWKRIYSLYTPDMFFFDFSFWNSFACFLFYVVFLGKKILTKRHLTHRETLELWLLGVLFLGVIFLAVGTGDVVKFFVPFYFVLAVLQAGCVYRLLLFFKRMLICRKIVFSYVAVLFVAGIISLFFPNIFVCDFTDYQNFYFYEKDDFNRSEISLFFEKKDLQISTGEVFFLRDKGDENPAGAFFSFWLKENGELKKSISLPLDRRINYACAFYRYDLNTEKEISKVDLLIADKYIQENIYADTLMPSKKKLLLKNIIPYGSKMDISVDVLNFDLLFKKHQNSLEISDAIFFLKRRYFCFIYEVAES